MGHQFICRANRCMPNSQTVTVSTECKYKIDSASVESRLTSTHHLPKLRGLNSRSNFELRMTTEQSVLHRCKWLFKLRISFDLWAFKQLSIYFQGGVAGMRTTIRWDTRLSGQQQGNRNRLKVTFGILLSRQCDILEYDLC
jgi:hypothetical protein